MKLLTVLMTSVSIGVSAPMLVLAGNGPDTVFCHGFEGPLDATAENYWPFDGDANDFWGIENGTIVGGAGFVPGFPSRPGDQAIELDGLTQRVDLPLTTGTSLAGLTAVSFSAFVYFDTIGGAGSYDSVFMLRRAAGGNHQIYTRVFDEGSFGIDSRPNVTDSQAHAGTAAGLISTGQWHHIAAVFDVTARTVRLFVDGQFVSEADVSGNWGPGSEFDGVTSHATFGSDPSSQTIHRMDGRINDARFFHRALSDEEIADLDRWASLCGSNN